MSKNNHLMALLSIWGIMLVVLGHSGYTGTTISEDFPKLHAWIYSFHMPLFFFISGYLFSLTNPQFLTIDKKRLIRKKLTRLLIPYGVLGTVLYGIKFAFSSLSSVERVFSIKGFFKMFISPSCEGSTMGYLWYLLTLFMCFMAMAIFCLLRIDLKKTSFCIIAIICAWALNYFYPKIGWFQCSSMLWYLPFFISGILYKTFEKRVNNILLVHTGGVIYS